MNNAIITIFKKEIARFFGDKRTAFSTILLPGIMIFVMYSFMGDALSNQFSVDESQKAECYVQNLPENGMLQEMMQSGFTVRTVSSEKDIEKAKEDIANKEADLCVIFPENFEKDVQIDHSAATSSVAPEVQVFYNSSESDSNAAFQSVTAILDEFEGMLTNRFDVNKQDGVSFDLASDEDSAAMIFSSMLPMLLLMYLFSGTIASMPKLMGGESDNLNGSVYSVSDYLLLALVILSTVLVLVTAVSLISAFSKSIKEAQTYCSPLVIVAALVGITAMFGSGASTNPVHYIIPLYNSVQSMVQIFSFEVVTTPILLTVFSNLLYSLIGAFCLTKMFQSEHIIFSK